MTQLSRYQALKNGLWRKAEGKNRENNNIKSNFLTTAKIFVRNIFLRSLNLIFENANAF